MPFDVREFPAGAEMLDRNRRWVASWLFALCVMVLGMIVLGGATRLSGSGLSIMEWAPLLGALPPLSEAEWKRLFGLYQQIPQYHLLHEGFGLDGFKRIFWLEWTHRLWGRLIGLAFIVPLLILWARGAIAPWLRSRLIVLFLLGGAQGAVGWFMVASGFLPDSTSVSAYRLVIHLSVALVLYVALLWTGLSVLWPLPAPLPSAAPRRLAAVSAGCLALTIVAGGFVAGTHAGLIYNTFPLMDGRLVPADYAAIDPFMRNLTENAAAVQFDHRLLATLSAILVIATVVTGIRAGAAGRLRWALAALMAAVATQYALGIATLLSAVPLGLATAHQATAVLALTAAVWVLHAARPAARPNLSTPVPALLQDPT
jgi:cytochrome c oxidase assembly protein subunit 15